MNKIYKYSFFHSVGVLAYITLVATIIRNGDRIFDEMENSLLGPIAFLLLFSLSALVVGGLIVGKPIMLYLDDKKKDAVLMFLATGGWLFIFLCIALLIQVLK